jgi:Ca-activated chloride channel homolog
VEGATAVSIQFDYPWLLLLAGVLPLMLVLVLLRADRRRRARFERLGDLAVVQRLVPAGVTRATPWRTARLAGACALVGVALAGPRWGLEHTVTNVRGFDMVLALDASLSMLATDERPSRLERVKQEVRRLRAMSTGDRIGLLVFAGRSYVLSPLTVDNGALDLFLDNLDPSIVGQGGSSMSRAIRQGTDLLSLGNSGVDRALIVMSDGEAFEPKEDIVAEARRANEQGISVVMVGFGTTTGSTIPMRAEDGSITRKRDENGEIVVTRYTPELLRAAAEAAHGTFVDAAETDKASRIRQALSTLRTEQRTAIGAETETPRFQWFLLPAVLLLLVDTFLSDLRARSRRGVARQAATAVGAAALAVTAGCTAMREAAAGADDYASKDYPRAVSEYRSAIRHGDARLATLYNFGTALLAMDSVQSTGEALARPMEAPDPELRFRSLFNFGLAYLKRGGTLTTEGGQDDLAVSLGAYKKALLLRSDDPDAKWNYELALRKKHDRDGGGGGGGGNTGQQSPAPNSDAPKPSGGLGQHQAEQILASAAREERDVQAKRQQQGKVEPPKHGKDW